MAKRRNSRKKSKKRKTRRSKRRVKRRKKKTKRRRKQKGGNSSCPYDKNMGEKFTLRKYNSNPMLPDPKSTNLSSDVPIPYIKSGGKKKRKNQKGGSGWYDFGFSDLVNSYFDATKAITDIPLKWRGKKTQLGANPMKQKIKTPRIQHAIPDIESHHRHGIIQAANYGDVARRVTTEPS